MDLVSKTLAPVRRAAHQFFRCHVRVSVLGGLRVEFVERNAPNARQAAAESEAQRRRAEAKQMVLELREVLQEGGADVREASRHLVFVEQALSREGLTALDTVPPDVLRKALEQFEDLVSNWSPVGLAGLRSRMAVALQMRDHDEAHTEAQAYQRKPSGAPTTR